MTWRDDPETRRTYAREYYRRNLAATPMWTGERKDTPRAAICPSPRELEWAAGFIEGEGCFHSYRRPSVSMSVSATQCEIEPLEKLQRMFGGRIGKKHMSARNRRQPYFWAVYGARARGVAMTIYGLLSSKRQRQCRAALKAVGAA